MIFIKDGYVIGVTIGDKLNNVQTLLTYANKPKAESGYDYRLCADTLEWELYELPEPINEETSTDDYEQTLNGLGG